LTGKPWHDPGDFAWTARLEAAHEAIRGELREVQALGFLRHHEQGLDERGSWTTYRLFAAGRKLEDQCRRCPETTRIVESIPDVCATGLVYFSVLSPGTHLAAHCGPTNTRLRCHLGLVVPSGSRIRVGEDTRAWEEGRCIVFDDSFEHEAWNEGDRGEDRADRGHLAPGSHALSERWALDRVVRVSPRARAYARSAAAVRRRASSS
jgi:aspartyl/asparaginyl beta-hydroxylase (cupin superfamily)